MKFGFELEAFIFNPDGIPVLAPYGLPKDECGWLAEVRSEPHADVSKAVSLLSAEVRTVGKIAEKLNLKLLYEPLFKIPRDLKVQAARSFGKGSIAYRNVYGFETHRCATDYATAAMHISFTEQRTFTYQERSACKECASTTLKCFNYQGFIDHAKLIVGLDAAFRKEIADAKRNPGFYEIKSDGRIEYRSLPNNVNLDKVEEVLMTLTKGM